MGKLFSRAFMMQVASQLAKESRASVLLCMSHQLSLHSTYSQFFKNIPLMLPPNEAGSSIVLILNANFTVRTLSFVIVLLTMLATRW